MSWIKQNSNLYTHSDAPFSLQYIGSIWYLVDNRDQSKAIPFSDIFNNPAYSIDLSNQDVLVNSLSSASFVNATHLRSETANTPATPGHSFKTEISSGMYRISAGKIGFSSLGTRVGEFGTDYGGFTGNIIQTINSSNSYSHVITSTSYTDILSAVGATWEIAITPKYTNSKILIIYSIVGQLYLSGSTQYVGFGISKKIGTGSYSRIFSPSAYQFGVAIAGVSALYYNNQNTNLYNDTSNTTQEIKYKIEGLIYNNALSGAFYVNSINGGGGGTMISTVNILEIQQ